VKNPVKWPTNWKDNYLSYISEKVTVIESRWPVQKIKINSQKKKKTSVNTFRKYCVYNSSQEVKQSPTKNISNKKNLTENGDQRLIYIFELVSEPNLSATFTNGSLFNVSNVEPLVLRKENFTFSQVWCKHQTLTALSINLKTPDHFRSRLQKSHRRQRLRTHLDPSF
jgi:hypothetical protein